MTTIASSNEGPREFSSTSEALRYLYQLSLDNSIFRFRGQANAAWTLKPSVYRFAGFKRYQTVNYESHVLAAKPPATPPLTHTNFDLEWLMICQHYGVPTRLLDWSNDILIGLYFACAADSELELDGAIFICDQRQFPAFAAYNEHAMETQELAFVNTSVINPRMRAQAGCFMIWGHAPLSKETKESYDLWQFHDCSESPGHLEKIRIPAKAKRPILHELKQLYGITSDTLYLANGYLEKEFAPRFKKLKEEARLKTLYMTNADELTPDEETQARSYFQIDCRNMIGECVSITRMG